MNILIRFQLITVVIFLLTSCQSFYPPWNSPRDYPINYTRISDEKVSIMSMTDEMRAVIIVPNALNGVNSDVRVCPEPPADAADRISRNFNAEVAASQTAPEDKFDENVKMANIDSSDVASILNRSQGLELFRDGANVLCLAWLNDVYNSGDINYWRDDFRHLLELSHQLIMAELELKK